MLVEVKVRTDLADDVTAPERGRVILHRHAEAPESELVQRQVVLEAEGDVQKDGWREVRQWGHIKCRQNVDTVQITSRCTRGYGPASSPPFSFCCSCFCLAAAGGTRSCPRRLCFRAADLCTRQRSENL